VARSVLRGCRDVVAGLMLTMSCALLLAVLVARLDVVWLLVVPIDRFPFWLDILGIRTRRSGTSQVETVELFWTTPLETVPIDRSPFWLVILGIAPL